VEGGIEAGDLRQVRLHLLHGADRGEVVRLMQRRQRHEGFQPGHRLLA
jgi:ribosomal protein S28E/S33